MLSWTHYLTHLNLRGTIMISIKGRICEKTCKMQQRKLKNSMVTVGFEVLTAVSMKMAVFWVVAPCTLV
jgi:uncharacterized radical SAM superfamily protein